MISAADIAVGDSREEVVVDDLSRTQIVMYAGASGDYNPLHSDDKFTTEVAGYPSVFAHGMLSMGLTGRIVTDWVGIDALKSYGVRFSKQVFPGATLTTTVTVKNIDASGDEPVAEFDVTTRDQDGDVVVVGYATARLRA